MSILRLWQPDSSEDVRQIYIIIYHIRHVTLYDDIWHFILDWYMTLYIILSRSDIGRLGIRLRKVQDMSWLRSRWSPGGPGTIRALGISQRVFLHRFLGGKKKQPNLKQNHKFVDGFFWAYPKKKNLSTRPFLECFFDNVLTQYHWYEFMISLLEVMHQITLGFDAYWGMVGTLLQKPRQGKKKNAALTCQSKIFRRWLTICKLI